MFERNFLSRKLELINDFGDTCVGICFWWSEYSRKLANIRGLVCLNGIWGHLQTSNMVVNLFAAARSSVHALAAFNSIDG
jgi:hypothetical protein